MRTAILWAAEGDKIRCGVCPNRCLIAPGHVGTCGVRENVDGTLVPLTYARLSSIAVDPIEKKPVFHYMPGSAVLSLGGVGCSMRCGHCQNWRISRAAPNDFSVESRRLDPEGAVRLAREYDCPGIAFTYNEPVIWIEYVLDVAKACKDAGLFTVMVTNGYITTEALDVIGPYIDVWRVDLKGANDTTYKQLCRVTGIDSIRGAAERAKHVFGMHVEVVTNVVPTVNDSPEEIAAMAQWVAALGKDTPWHITRFFPYLDYADLDPTPIETLEGARQAGIDAGLDFVYLGNTSQEGGEDTRCPSCGRVAVERSGYTILARHTREGTCEHCGTELNITE